MHTDPEGLTWLYVLAVLGELRLRLPVTDFELAPDDADAFPDARFYMLGWSNRGRDSLAPSQRLHCSRKLA